MFALIRLELEGFRPFKLGVFDKITFEPTSTEQVVLGSNGSGKSSLLKEVYSIVPNGKLFKTGIGRKVHLARVGSQFIRTTSVFKTKAGHYNFEISKDGETWTECNESGLQSEQRLLVKKYFNLDDDLIALMTDSVTLTKMDAKERRQWMMRICGTDFSYINKLHEHFKRRHSDFRGTVRVLTDSLANTVKDFEMMVTTSEDYATETNVLEEIVQVTSQGIEKIGGETVDLTQLRKQLSIVANEISEQSTSLLKLAKLKQGDFYYLSRDEVANKSKLSEAKHNELQGKRTAIEERLREVQAAIDSIGRENLAHPSNVDEQISNISDQLKNLPKVAGEEFDSDRWVSLVKSAEIAQGRLQGPLSGLPVGVDRKVLIGEYNLAKTKLEKLIPYQTKCTTNHQAAISRLDHWEHVDKVDCPECKVSFKPGLDSSLLADVQRAARYWESELNKVTIQVAELQLTCQNFEAIDAGFKEIQTIMNQHQECVELWDAIESNRLLETNPMAVMTLIANWIEKGYRIIEAIRLHNELTRLNDIKAVMKEDKGHLLTTADNLEASLYETLKEMGDYKSIVKKIEGVMGYFGTFERQLARYEQKVNEHKELVDTLARQTLKQHLQDVRKRSTVRMGVLHQLQEKHRVLSQRIELLKEQLIQARDNLEVSKLLDKATSSNEGIVVDIIKDFMDRFLGLYNNNLRKVWSYDILVSEAPDKGQVFTCQFPVHIGDDPEPIDDVSDGSTGQESLFNFVFKLIVFKLEGLKDYPLLADEFGKDFDDEHRESLVNFIKGLMEDKDFSQLFMVSHYSSVYSCFDLAEFVVLDDRNIVRPAEYNTGITFE